MNYTIIASLLVAIESKDEQHLPLIKQKRAFHIHRTHCPTTEPVWTIYGIEYAQSARTWNFLSRQHPAGKVCDRERHVLWVSCSLNEGIQPHGRWEISLLPSDWPIFGRGGRGQARGQGGVMWPNLAERLIMEPPLTAGWERENGLDENQKNLYHTQAVYCCLFTGLHLGPLYHSIRTAFTPHSREKGPSIKLKTSRCHWRAHRKRPKVLSLLSFLSLSLSLSLSSCYCCSGLCDEEKRGRVKERKKASNRGHLLTPELLSLSFFFISFHVFSPFLLFSPSIPLRGNQHLQFCYVATGVSCV